MEELGRGAQLASQSIMCRMDRKGMASEVAEKLTCIL